LSCAINTTQEANCYPDSHLIVDGSQWRHV
jgi:hypothetical protein